MCRGGADREGDAEMTEEEDADSVEPEETEVTIGEQAKKPIRVKKVPLHPKALVDLCVTGKEKMTKKNLVPTRKKKKERSAREQIALRDDLKACLTAMDEAPFQADKITIARRRGEMPRRFLLANQIRSMTLSTE